MCTVLSGAHCKYEEERSRQFAALGESSESQTHMVEIQRRLQDGVTLSSNNVEGRR